MVSDYVQGAKSDSLLLFWETTDFAWSNLERDSYPNSVLIFDNTENSLLDAQCAVFYARAIQPAAVQYLYSPVASGLLLVDKDSSLF